MRMLITLIAIKLDLGLYTKFSQHLLSLLISNQIHNTFPIHVFEKISFLIHYIISIRVFTTNNYLIETIAPTSISFVKLKMTFFVLTL